MIYILLSKLLLFDWLIYWVKIPILKFVSNLFTGLYNIRLNRKNQLALTNLGISRIVYLRSSFLNWWTLSMDLRLMGKERQPSVPLKVKLIFTTHLFKICCPHLALLLLHYIYLKTKYLVKKCADLWKAMLLDQRKLNLVQSLGLDPVQRLTLDQVRCSTWDWHAIGKFAFLVHTWKIHLEKSRISLHFLI